MRLRAVQQPSRVERLLVAFASSSGVVAPDAYLLRDPSAMPSALQGLIGEAVKQGHAWCCWKDDSRRVWLLIGEMLLELSRVCGSPVLDVEVYGEDGKLKESDRWLVDKEGEWRRCTVAIAKTPQRNE